MSYKQLNANIKDFRKHVESIVLLKNFVINLRPLLVKFWSLFLSEFFASLHQSKCTVVFMLIVNIVDS